MLTLIERAPTGEDSRRESRTDRVLFGTSTVPRGRATSRPKLSVVYEGSREPHFAELAWTAEEGYRLAVKGADFGVFLNGRAIAVGTAVSAEDGDVLRVGDERFVIGEPPAFPRSDVEAGLLDSLRASPADDALRLVYADWLEEQGDSVYAEFLRLELRIKGASPDDHALPALIVRFHDLANDVGSRAWRLLVARPLIERCEVSLELSCPKKWEALARTDQDGVRRCDACAKDVVFCTSIATARDVARRGGCVAVDPALTRYPNDLDPPPMLVGRVVLRDSKG